MNKLSENTAVSIGLVIIIVGIAIWLTRLSEKVDYQLQRVDRLEGKCDRILRRE